MDSDLPVISYDKVGNQVYKVTILPKNLGKHDMKVLYNNRHAPGKYSVYTSIVYD